jgi:hypothetical protein
MGDSIVISETIFDKLLLSINNSKPDKKPNLYYHCIQKDKAYVCKLVTGNQRIIPVYPDLPASMHAQVLEGTLNAPVTIQK